MCGLSILSDQIRRVRVLTLVRPSILRRLTVLSPDPGLQLAISTISLRTRLCRIKWQRKQQLTCSLHEIAHSTPEQDQQSHVRSSPDRIEVWEASGSVPRQATVRCWFTIMYVGVCHSQSWRVDEFTVALYVESELEQPLPSEFTRVLRRQLMACRH